jgi:glycosyltransferase involved in cell wall biosynthesis
MGGPVHVLELRSVRGTGGGPEKTILNGTALADPERVRVTVAYLRHVDDPVFGIDAWAHQLGVDYVEVRERHALDPAIWKQLVAIVRERRIDVVHAHDYKTNLLALLLARRTGISPLATEHGWTGHSWKERTVYYPADRRLARCFPHVIAVSSHIRQALIDAGSDPRRVTTVLNGIDPAAFRRDPGHVQEVRASLGLAPDETVIGSVGRLEPQKRFDLLIAAFRAVATTTPGLRLVIAGDGSQRENLTALIQDAGLQGRARLIGHRTDIADLHHAFDLFVQSSDYEGTPNTVLEAMAMETPVVATDAGGTRELARDGEHALIVPPGDWAALSVAITRALTDTRRAALRARDARERVERELSFEARTRRVETICVSLATRRQRAACGTAA